MEWRKTMEYLRTWPEDEEIHRAACYAAGEWTSCPIGEHRARLEAQGEAVGDYGRPHSTDLCRLGVAFYEAIANRAYHDAEYFFTEIAVVAAKGACMIMYTPPHDIADYGIHEKIAYRLTRDMHTGSHQWACADAGMDSGAYWRQAPHYEWTPCDAPHFLWRNETELSHDVAGTTGAAEAL